MHLRRPLTSPCRIRNRVKRIAERYLADVARIFIVPDLGIDEIDHWHAHFLPRLQGLLGKAEALHLGEIFACLRRFNIEAGAASDGFVTIK